MNTPRGSLVTTAFGTTVVVWFVAYVGHLPAVMLPAWTLALAMLACLLGGGWLLGRNGGGGALAGALAGAGTGVLNLLILGSLLGGEHPGQVVPSAWLWVPGSVLATCLPVAAGAAVGRRAFRPDREANWNGAFFWVAVGATALLLGVGGLVTSAEAGLAVDDWPTSFGYNMFLYPLSKMTGGIYFEHAHRLIGFLVGLTTLTAALLTGRLEERPWVRRLAWIAVAAVVVQAVLGGIRVTARSLPLAMAHGVLAQLFFSTLVALTAFTSKSWRGAGAPAAEGAGTRMDRLFSGFFVLLLLIQLVLGAAQRHFQELLLLHILTGLAVVAPAGVHVGFRTWGANPGSRRLRRLGLTLVGLIGVQVLLGFGAFMATRGAAAGSMPVSADLWVSTLHQWTGAVLLGTAVLVACWTWRLAGGGVPAGAAAAR